MLGWEGLSTRLVQRGVQSCLEAHHIDTAQQCHVIALVFLDVGHDVLTMCKTENRLLLSIFSVSAFSLLLIRSWYNWWNCKPGNGRYSSWKKTQEAWKIFNHHFQSSARPLIVTSCIELHRHCFLRWYTKHDWISFSPCHDLHPHSTSGLVPCCKTCCSNICNTKAKRDATFSRPEAPGIWGLTTWYSELTYTLRTSSYKCL